MMSTNSVVLMVDDKKRDLMVASMISHALKQREVRCHLVPLEAYRGALEAYRPRMIIFNHLTASHLANYSNRLAKMGVLTSVLLSEGLCYGDEERLYNAGKHHTAAHVDFFFAWNQPIKDSLTQVGFGDSTRIEVTGPPRFDTYFSPWAKLFQKKSSVPQERPRVLVCTNFGFAKFHDLPEAEADKLFAPWKDRIPSYRDYKGLIENNYQSSRRIFDYLNEIVRAKCFDLMIRPHPREELHGYQEWFAQLDPEDKKWVHLDQKTNITELLFSCDIHLSCEDCTTAMEAWMAGKPTVELVFGRHPTYYSPFFAELQVLCDDPSRLAETIHAQLKDSKQSHLQEKRKAHLQKWCNSPSGDSVQKIADIIANAVKNSSDPDWSKLEWNDFRRGWKLKLMNFFGQAYHFDPLLFLKKLIFPRKYHFKASVYEKAIRPRDVAKMREKIDECFKNG